MRGVLDVSAHEFVPLGQLFLSLPSVTVETPVYFVPSCLTAAVLAGCSVPLVAEIARNRGAAGRALLAVCACAAVALIAIPAARDWPGADLSRVRHYDEFTSKALEVIPAGGLLLSPNYQWTEAYLYKILGARVLTAIERLMGMVIVAISVQMLLDGLALYLRLGQGTVP